MAGSALPGGHKPRVGFFRVAQLLASAVPAAALPFACDVGAITVDVEAVDAMDEEEF